jgi:hypothetical protein
MIQKRAVWILAVALLVTFALGRGVPAGAQGAPDVPASITLEAGANPISGTVQCGLTYFPAGWYIVGAPAGFVIPGATGNLYTFQAGDTAYQTVPVTSGVKPGYGYWAYFPSETSGTMLPTAADSQTVQVTLPPNQPVLIGDPFSTPASVDGADSLTIYQPQTGTYVTTFSLGQGQGAWAFSLKGGQVTLKSICPVHP